MGNIHDTRIARINENQLLQSGQMPVGLRFGKLAPARTAGARHAFTCAGTPDRRLVPRETRTLHIADTAQPPSAPSASQHPRSPRASQPVDDGGPLARKPRCLRNLLLAPRPPALRRLVPSHRLATEAAAATEGSGAMNPGSIVPCRNRDWIRLPAESDDTLALSLSRGQRAMW